MHVSKLGLAIDPWDSYENIIAFTFNYNFATDIDSDSIGSGSGLSEWSAILQRGHELKKKLKKPGENKYQLYSYFT